nr:hypothetical protein [Tanacetum cinerariifolium]
EYAGAAEWGNAVRATGHEALYEVAVSRQVHRVVGGEGGDGVGNDAAKRDVWVHQRNCFEGGDLQVAAALFAQRYSQVLQ